MSIKRTSRQGSPAITYQRSSGVEQRLRESLVVGWNPTAGFGGMMRRFVDRLDYLSKSYVGLSKKIKKELGAYGLKFKY